MKKPFDFQGRCASAFAAMSSQDSLYRPTAFWDEASRSLADEIAHGGVENFRRLSGPLGYFVPTYGPPGNWFTGELQELLLDTLSSLGGTEKAVLGLKQFLVGEAAAYADYRVLLAGDEPVRAPYLDRFSESPVGKPLEQFCFEGRYFSRSALNYLLGLAALKKVALRNFVPRTVLEIGGGFGTLGEILGTIGIDAARYIDIDIPPTLLVADYYLGEVFGRESLATWEDAERIAAISIDELPDRAVLAPWQLQKLHGKIDLFVNFISFQEMEPSVVSNYLSLVAGLAPEYVILRNIREGKQRKSAERPFGVEQPVRGDDYVRFLNDFELVDRAHAPFGFRTVDGFHSELLIFRRTG
jgi:putative sugar O-methyltransferase